MNPRTTLLFAALLITPTVRAQCPTGCALPGRGPSPLFYVRFTGPEGMEATFYQGRARPRSFPAPVVVGLRPGYLYRLQLANLANRPGLTLFPTVEVRGSLKLKPAFGAHCFPATIHLNQDDLEAVSSGSMVTKVIYLEHPDRAEPTATRCDQTLELAVARDRDIYNEARDRGRIMLVVHLGGRIPTPDELATVNVPGTILMPGQKVIGPAYGPPCLQGTWCSARPMDEECLHDGGDRLQPAGFDSRGEIGGIDPEDTVAEYRDSAGRRQITCSNRVCLCVPRYAALRKECPAALSETVVGPADRTGIKKQVAILERMPPLEAHKYEQPRGYAGRLRPGENVNVQKPGHFIQLKILQAQELNLGPFEYVGTKRVITLTEVQKALLVKQFELVKEFSQIVSLAGYDQILHTSVMGRVKGPEVVTGSLYVRDLTVCCCETPLPPDRPLVLVKCADKGAAKPGDIVTFTLRYSNVGGRPITDVAVADSLSGRLEYVPGSAEADRDAVFTVQENEAGSSLLRWEITGTLQPGQSGRVRFKAKVR